MHILVLLLHPVDQGLVCARWTRRLSDFYIELLRHQVEVELAGLALDLKIGRLILLLLVQVRLDAEVVQWLGRLIFLARLIGLDLEIVSRCVVWTLVLGVRAIARALGLLPNYFKQTP